MSQADSLQEPRIILFQNHDEQYYYTKAAGLQGIELVHIDPHCDMYGALINNDGTMCQIRNDSIYEGNFLVHSVVEGTYKKIVWAYDEYGDRRYDDFAVLFEDDLLMKLPWLKARHRKLHRFTLSYKKIELDKWDGMRPGEHLSLDWDHFALDIKDPEKIDSETSRFLERDWSVTPPVTYLCYSPGYVHHSEQQFTAFAQNLAKKFGGAEVIKYERPANYRTYTAPTTIQYYTEQFKQLPRKILFRLGLHF